MKAKVIYSHNFRINTSDFLVYRQFATRKNENQFNNVERKMISDESSKVSSSESKSIDL